MNILNNQKIRYLMIGISNTIFGYIVFTILWFNFEKIINDSMIIIISHLISVFYAFIGHKYFVFKSNGSFFKELFNFNAAYFFSLFLNIIFFKILHNYFFVNPYVSQAVITFFIVILNFYLNKKLVFTNYEKKID